MSVYMSECITAYASVNVIDPFSSQFQIYHDIVHFKFFNVIICVDETELCSVCMHVSVQNVEGSFIP